MGAVRSCRCKDKHNLLSGQQSATINFPRSPYRCSRFCCPFAVPLLSPLPSLCGAAGVPPSACRPPPCRPPPCRPPTYCLPHAPFSASLSFVPASISACSFLPSPACCPPPPPADCRPAARNFGRAARFQLQGVADADFFAIFAWRFVRAARYETKRRIAFFLRSELRQFRMQGEEADAPAVMQRGRIL